MINLVNTSLYSFNKTYDYQSVCDPEKDSKAAAGPRSIYVVRYKLHIEPPSPTPIYIYSTALFRNCIICLPSSSPAYHCRPAEYWLVGLQCCLVSTRLFACVFWSGSQLVLQVRRLCGRM